MQSEFKDQILIKNINENSDEPKQKTENEPHNNLCPICGRFFNNFESLKVHMQYQHEDMNNRWNLPPPPQQQQQPPTSIPTTTSTTPPTAITSTTSAVVIQDLQTVTTTTTNTTALTGTNTDLSNSNSSNSNLLENNNTTIANGVGNNNSSTNKHQNTPKKSQILDTDSNQLAGITVGNKLNYNQQQNLKNIDSTLNSTVSAAADSSDNQPATPQPQQQQQSSINDQSQRYQQHHQNLTSAHQQHYSSPQQNSNLLPITQDMHPYPAAYMHGYDQFYHPPAPPPTGMDYSSGTLYPGGNQTSSGGPPILQDHKLLPTPRYHPYLNNGSHHHQNLQQNLHQQIPNQSNSGTTNGSNTNPSSSISNSSLSPRVVSSSSPTQNSMIAQQQQQQNSQDTSMTQISTGQPTPSPSPKQCDKCGFVCPTEAQLSEHYTTVHGSGSQTDSIRSGGTPVGGTVSTGVGELPNQYSYQPYIKEEPSSDILDLDSQKMVYPPTHNDSIIQEQPLPPMHSMHPMHRPLHSNFFLHNPDMHSGYMSQVEMKQPYYPSIKQPYPGIKQEYISMKQSDYPPGSGFSNQLKMSDYHHQSIAPQTRPDIKPFGADITSANNPASSSPSEFPSTTTPQENGPQFRGFEPPTSSLPNNTATTKATTWKSNEARRPKTYNCTACNKWFTSSGHLKRHYNTTLHKNAVKSSGQPDPATMPISAHHHPSRDPNSKHSRSRNNSSHQQPPPAPPEPPTSPEYTPQYTPPPSSFSQQQHQQQQQQFQPYPIGLHSTTSSNGHPNGQAGPSVQTSQPRGLLITSNMDTSNHHLDQEDQVLNNTQHLLTNSSPREDLYNLQQDQSMEIILGDNNSPNHQLNLEDLHHQVDQHQQQQLPPLQHQLLQQQHQTQHTISHHHIHHLQEESHLHQDTIIPSPTITTIHHNTIMDQQQQQQQYINPLDINPITPIIHTNIIQSYQHQQQPVEHQNYHTTIGNDSNLQNNNLDMDTFTNHFQINGDNGSSSSFTDHQIIQTTSDGNIQVTTLNPSIVELHRLSGGEMLNHNNNNNMQHDDNMILPYSPAIPDYLRQKTLCHGERSPQEGDIPPPHQSATGPSPSYPNSPTISSSTATLMVNYDGTMLSATLPASPAAAQPPTPTQTKITTETVAVKKPTASKRKKTISSSSSSSSSGTVPSPNGKIECIQCDKEFAKICYLTQHNKTFHSGEQPFRCTKCGKRFHFEEAYNVHIDKHNAPSKPHKCDKCIKEFHYQTDLRRHRDIHTGYRAHVCDICSKGFCRRDHLRKHIETHKPKPLKKKSQNAKNKIKNNKNSNNKNSSTNQSNSNN